MTPLGSSPGGEVFYVSSEELAAKVASRLQAIKLVYITKGQCLVDTRQSRIIAVEVVDWGRLSFMKPAST
eukprot:g29339.t1